MSDQSDPFATSVVDEDPFAEPTPDPEPEPSQAPAEEPPVVNREGQPAAPPAPPDPPPPVHPPAPEPEAAQEAQEPAQEPPAPPEAPPEPPAAQEPQEAPSAPESAPEPDPEPEPEPQAPPASEEGTGPRGGKAVMRHYKVLMQTGPDQFTLIKLADDNGKAKEHVVTLDGELYLEARNNEHAYKLAYHVVGRPQGGARVWPVPKASYRPRMVKPKPPEPERERLSIS